MMKVIGVSSFSIVAFALSWVVGRRSRTADEGEVSFSVLLVSWAALFFGMYMTRL
jgi:hypothetical protein